MAETFTLDTSGVALATRPDGSGHLDGWRWSDLSPFAQGYVEAAWRQFCDEENDRRAEMHGHVNKRIPAEDDYGFSDWSPEALAMILADCERFRGQYVLPNYDGEALWRERQAGELLPYFPPLTVFLTDDGKVGLAVAK